MDNSPSDGPDETVVRCETPLCGAAVPDKSDKNTIRPDDFIIPGLSSSFI